MESGVFGREIDDIIIVHDDHEVGEAQLIVAG